MSGVAGDIGVWSTQQTMKYRKYLIKISYNYVWLYSLTLLGEFMGKI